MESQDIFGGRCEFARPEALDEIWAVVLDCSGRQVREPDVQVGGDRDAVEGRPSDRGEDCRALLDVLGRRIGTASDVGRFDSLDAGGRYARKSRRIVTAPAGTLCQPVSGDGSAARAD